MTTKKSEGQKKSSARTRRTFLQQGLTAGGALALTLARVSAASAGPSAAAAPPRAFALEEATIDQLREGLASGRYTARSLARLYLERIGQIDRRGPALNSVIELNPDAFAIAAARDRERPGRNSPREFGPLHGIPVLIKDNIDTADRMTTTAGSLALAGSIPLRDSFVADRLRAAGAVILGKTNLSEWANFRSSHSTSGWSGRGGQTRNPYALDRNPCGSSSGSGTAVAASLCAVAVGTETDGSVVCPSSSNGLVGIKPTVGLVGRSGIIPISHSQDTAGPMARTVRDAAILLGALTGADSRDRVTDESRGKAFADYTQFLDPRGLNGARVGVARKFWGFNDRVDKLMDAAIDALKKLGAVVIDPANIETAEQFGDSEFEVLLYEFKAGLNKYFGELGPRAPVRTLKEVIEFNDRHKEREMPYFGQDILIKAEAKGPLTEKTYRDALGKNHRLSRREGIDAVMKKHRLDAMVAPTGSPAWPTDLINGDHTTGGFSSPAAVAGYPHITVPAGFDHGLPVGLSFFGGAYSEPKLIKYAYAYEQATKHRRPPRFARTINLTGLT
ncbi:MAG TPA: amidase [Pyrinomonadaceae bacterium]|nr:amidase [Pyrinomonadaceae bacterium]